MTGMLRETWWWPWWVSSLIDLTVVFAALVVFHLTARRVLRALAALLVVAGLVPDTPDGHAPRLAYYEARKLNNPPTSLLDYNDAKRGLETPTERALVNNATTPPA
jgi:hypothetical protein